MTHGTHDITTSGAHFCYRLSRPHGHSATRIVKSTKNRSYPSGNRTRCSSVPQPTAPPSRLQLKCDGTRWRTGEEVKGKMANGVGSQYPSHYLGTWCIQHYYRWCAHLGCQQSTELTPSADLNGLVRFVAERRNLISARVPSRFSWPLPRH